MNHAQKMWKRVLSMVLALVLVMGMVPVTDVQAATESSVELSSDNTILEITAENSSPTANITIDTVYDETNEEVNSENWTSVEWSIDDGDENTSETIVADKVDIAKATATVAERGIATVSVVVKYEQADEEELKEAIGKIDLTAWETPVVTINTDEVGETAEYPTKVEFTATSSNGAEPAITIKNGEDDVTYLNGKELPVGTYTVTAVVNEDATNYYRGASANHTYTVTVGETKGTIDVPEAVYWNDKITFTLPEQSEITGKYKVTLSNIEAKDGVIPENPGETVTLVANTIGEATVKVEFVPEDDTNYAGFDIEKVVSVSGIPVEAYWETGEFTKKYDGTHIFKTNETPKISFADSYTGSEKIPELVSATEYEFTLENNAINASETSYTATLNKVLELKPECSDYYVLQETNPEIQVKVDPIELTAENINEFVAVGKNYDGTSEVVFTTAPELIQGENILTEDFEALKEHFTYQANYYDVNNNKVCGEPENDVDAAQVILKNLSVNSVNYTFGSTEVVKTGTFTIEKNAVFSEFTGLTNEDDLGTPIEQKDGENVINVYWYKDSKVIKKESFKFSDTPEESGSWVEEYTVSEENLTKIYARNSEGLVSQGIYVAFDNTEPEGDILAKVGADGTAVSIKQLIAEYKTLSKGNTIDITFRGSDAHSKISKIEWYGSNEALTTEESELENVWNAISSNDIETINVNTGVDKSTNLPADEESPIVIQKIGEQSDIKRFYYAKITDFAGNVSYITSSGVLQDINQPTVTIQLAESQGGYDEKNVYASDVELTVKITDAGISSGISDVEAILTKNGSDILAEKISDQESKSIWTSTNKVTAIWTLNKADNPTDEQIFAANSGDLAGVLKDLEDGNYYTLTITAKDKVGHSHTTSVDFIKDSSKPKIKIVNDDLIFEETRTDLTAYTGGTIQVEVSDMTLTTAVNELISKIDNGKIVWAEPIVAADGLKTQIATLTFGPGEGKYNEGYYSLDVKAKDSLGLIAHETTGNFIIDYTAPTYNVSYNAPAENSYLSDDNKLYYNRDIVAEFTINEETTYDDKLINILVKNSKGEEVIKWPYAEGENPTKNDKYVFDHESGSETFVLTIKGDAKNDDDGYTFEISGKDKAGNVLEAVDATDTEEVAKVRAMDMTAPVLNDVEYDTADAFNTVGTRDYVNAPTKMTFTIAEHNPTINKSFITSDNVEKDSEWKISSTDVYTTELNVPMLGEKGDEQTITLAIVDKAGNVAVLGTDTKLRSADNTTFENGKFTDRFTVDTVAPKIWLEYESFNPDRLNVDGIDYFKQPITVKVTIDEHNFDETLFTQPVEKTNAAVTYAETAWVFTGDVRVKTFTFSKDNQYDLSIIGTDNAKNALSLQTVDKVTATSEANSTVALKVAVDQTLPAIGDTAKPVVVIKPSSAGTTIDGQALYNTDAVYEVVVYDPLLNNYASGIDNITFSVKGEDGTSTTCTVDKAGNIVNGKGVTVTRVGGDVAKLAQGVNNKYTFNVNIASGTFNTNGIVLSVKAEDVSTNKKEMSATPIAIDVTAPKAEVSYDNNDVSNDKYFHAERTATVTVTERNFSDDCFEFIVNGENKKLEFKLSNKGSGNRDDAVWTASYTFNSDGDYEVECTLKDRADNTGTVTYSGEAPQDFTIDMTNPVVKIEFDNHNVFNESYYDAQRIATIIITEHNFNGSDVVIIGEGTDAGVEVTYPSLGAWSSNGDEHRATLTYAQDALYTLDVEYEDLATNKANDVEEERFTVDTTDPELTITGVENETPYPDEIRPRIDFSDNNYDRYEAVLTRTERENIGLDVTEEIVGTIGVAIDATGKGVGGKLIEDVEHLEENDGIYTLTVTVYDKAGRSMEETVVYSVNRFGSVYVYSDDLAAMLKGYHQKVEGELYITAYNADQLIEDSTKLEITCDGASLANQSSQSDVTEALQPNNGGWFEYKFDLSHADFENDGRYTITISDKDEAGNTRTNSDSPIEFYIDATAPVLDSVIGLEEAIVNANEQTVQYAISDAIALANVKIFVDDKEISNIEEFESLTAHNSAFTIGAGMKQKVRIVAEDKAGNVLDTAAETFAPAFAFQPEITVSTNFFVRWYANTPLFWGSMAGIAAVAAAGIIALVVKKRKKQDEEE